MKTLTSTLENGNEFEETTTLYGMYTQSDTPRPGDGDETVNPTPPKKPQDPSEEGEGEVRPTNF